VGKNQMLADIKSPEARTNGKDIKKGKANPCSK
jgi:hypothetical protein